MKTKLTFLALVLTAGLFASGCATATPVGTFYTELSLPVNVAGGAASYSKVGKATSNSYFALIATGDSSIETAAKNGGISKIKFIDWKVKNILGFMGEYTTYVYGD